MNAFQDGPKSTLFTPLPLTGNVTFAQLAATPVSAQMAKAAPHAPQGERVGWGIPFDVRDPIVLYEGGQAVIVSFAPLTARQLVFMHTSDVRSTPPGTGGFIRASRRPRQL